MTKKVPSELLEQRVSVAESIDRQIVEALAWLEQSPDVKPTLDALATRAGVSRSTVRNRRWVKDKLNKIKSDRKICNSSLVNDLLYHSEPTIESIRKLLENALVENAILFQEIIGLNDEISNLNRRKVIPDDSVVIKKSELEALRNRHLFKPV